MTDYMLIQVSDCGMQPIRTGTVNDLKRLVTPAYPWEEAGEGWWAWQSRRFMVGYHIWPSEQWADWLREHPVPFVEPYVRRGDDPLVLAEA